MSRFASRRGFNLVEVMVAVALLGVIAGVALPWFSDARDRIRRAEPLLNLEAIAQAQRSYASTFDTYVPAVTNPGYPVSADLKPWRSGAPGWEQLGWAPDGEVRCTYSARVSDGDWRVVLESVCDIDSDGEQAKLMLEVTDHSEPLLIDLHPERF